MRHAHVEPRAELAADFTDESDLFIARGLDKLQTGLVCGNNSSDNHVVVEFSGSRLYCGEQGRTYAPSSVTRCDIDRGLGRVRVGSPRSLHSLSEAHPAI